MKEKKKNTINNNRKNKEADKCNAAAVQNNHKEKHKYKSS